MTRTTSVQGRAFIEHNEGCSLTAYPDPPGQSTQFSIGFGHLLDAGETYANGITQDEADALLSADLRPREACVNSKVQVDITQAQFDALVDFVYNEGMDAFSGSTTLRRLNAGDYQGAADALLMWDRVMRRGQLVEDGGLLARRVAERKMFLSDVPPSPDVA
ncbi:MAG TPA: lysozyme [Candidatus Dormibacteraeota bacterium]|jgi:lysozyme